MLVGLGSFVVLGWLTRQAWMVQAQPGQVAMVFNSAVCFLLLGLGLTALESTGQWLRAVALVCSVTTLLITAVVLVQWIPGVRVGIDAPSFHAWLGDGNPHPGRMAPNTCVAFLLGACASLALAVHSGQLGARSSRVFRGLVFMLFLTALTGFVGYWLRTDVVLEWRHVRMALPTAIGLLVLSAGLWSALEKRSPTERDATERRISRAAALVLTVSVLTAGLAGFAILVGQTQVAITAGLQQRLDFRIALLEDALRDGRAAALTLASVPAWAEIAEQSAEAGPNPMPATLLAGHGLKSLQLLSLDGRVLQSQGAPATASSLDVPLDASGNERLRWDGATLLMTRTPVRASDGRVLGHLVIERPLPQLAQRLTDVPADYPTGEIVICARGPGAQLTCLPNASHPRVFRIAGQTPSGTPLPMARALAGASGVGSALDYRGINVIAAYAPAAGGNLAMVVKQDASAIYAPIRSRLQWVLPMLGAMVVLGLLLLRSQVRPLARRLAQSDRENGVARQQLASILHSISDALIISDAQGTIIMVNEAAERIFGYRAGDLCGRNIRALMPATYHAAHDSGMQRYLEHGTRKIIGHGSVELEGQRQDGSVFPIELTVDVAETEGVPTLIGVVRDITARQEVQQVLAFEKERLRVTLHSIGDAVITTDNHGVVTYLNPVAEHLLRWPAQEAIGQRIGLVFNIIHQATGDIAPSPVDFVLSTGSIGGLADDTMLVRRDGSQIAIEDSAAPIRSAAGATLGVVLVFHDVTSAREIAGRISHQASHDPLTDLINRREFEQRLTRVLAGSDMQGKGHALLYLDLDQFKVVNDTAGHTAGDELLKTVAGLLRNCLRERDHLARLGGDEFAILLEHCPQDVAVRIAETLRKSVADFRFSWKDRSFAIGVSIGLVPFRAGDSFTDLLSFADSACYIAKDKGRNRVHLHHAGDTDVIRHNSELHWAPRIDSALADGRFVLFGQKIAAIGDGKDGQPHGAAHHYEVLLRMVDEQGELVSPMAFIPTAERYGQMPALDRWVVEAALSSLAARQLGQGEALHLSINLSGKTLGDDSFIEFVEAAFRKHRVPHQQICFEITETAAIANLSQAGKFINWFRQHGCLFSLDDFGAGMSSFSYLKHLRVDFIKIDGGFVKDILTDPIDEAMVIAINNVGQVMGLRTVAEFVENQAILERLRILGVDFAQGYGVHKPEPLRAILDSSALCVGTDRPPLTLAKAATGDA